MSTRRGRGTTSNVNNHPQRPHFNPSFEPSTSHHVMDDAVVIARKDALATGTTANDSTNSGNVLAVIARSRSTGSLVLSGRGLDAVPFSLFSFDDPSEVKKGGKNDEEQKCYILYLFSINFVGWEAEPFRKVDLSMNKIQEWPASFTSEPLQLLSVLNLSGNLLKSIPEAVRYFAVCYLTFL